MAVNSSSLWRDKPARQVGPTPGWMMAVPSRLPEANWRRAISTNSELLIRRMVFGGGEDFWRHPRRLASENQSVAQFLDSASLTIMLQVVAPYVTEINVNPLQMNMLQSHPCLEKSELPFAIRFQFSAFQFL
jgi:hypothetical protein